MQRVEGVDVSIGKAVGFQWGAEGTDGMNRVSVDAAIDSVVVGVETIVEMTVNQYVCVNAVVTPTFIVSGILPPIFA